MKYRLKIAVIRLWATSCLVFFVFGKALFNLLGVEFSNGVYWKGVLVLSVFLVIGLFIYVPLYEKIKNKK